MRNFVAAILILAATGPFPVFADEPPEPAGSESARLEFPAHGCSLVLPPGWTRTPDAVVAAADAEVASRVPGRNFQYIGAASREHDGSLIPPYIIVQVTAFGQPISGASYDQIEKGLGAYSSDDLETVAETSLKDLVDSVKMNQIVLDRARNRTTFNFELTAGSDTLRGLAIGFLGSDRMISINCYQMAGEFDQTLPQFQAIIDGFSWQPGREFVPGNGSSGIWGNVIRGAIFGALFGLGLAAIAVVRKALNKSKTPPGST